MVRNTAQRNPIEVIGEEFLEKRRLGESATVEEYADQYPDLASEILHLFPAMLALEDLRCSRQSSKRPTEMNAEAPRRLGDFEIIQEIGRGGMGVVYEAEQISLERTVAVKVLPQEALDDSRQLDRFRRESSTAARLHHTNIVPVFGVGEHEGTHFYVMQRIKGVSLDRAIHRHRRATSPETDDEVEPPKSTVSLEDLDATTLSSLMSTTDDASLDAGRKVGSRRTPPDRSYWKSVAKIGIQVASALEYAHSLGVLHRDVKPANLLLDAAGAIWVTDFGLATLLNTEHENTPSEMAGTLRFMAPERFQGEQDAKSDIYSLGLTLYELLTLQPAFGASSRAATVNQILNSRLTSPRTYCREIPGDLEAIVLKASARSPNDRYDSAAELGEDLRRFVEGRPVCARRTGVVGRAWRWTKRNPMVASLSAALLTLTVVSFIVIGAKWRWAVAENQRAEGNLSVALESLDQILERFASDWMAHPATVEGENGEEIEFQLEVSDGNAEFLQDTLRFYDRFTETNGENPNLRRETAKVHRRVADIYQRLGDHEKAEVAYSRSLACLSSISSDDDPSLVVERSSALNQLGRTFYATSRVEKAEAAFTEARKFLGDHPQRNASAIQAELARTYNNLGQAQWLMRQHGQARISHQRAVGILEALVREHPARTDYRLALARAYRSYQPYLVFERRAADRVRSSGIRILEALVRDHPNVPDYRCELSETLVANGVFSRRPSSFRKRLGQSERAVELARDLAKQHPSIPRYRVALARALKFRANSLPPILRDESEAYLSECVGLYRDLSQVHATIPAYHTFLAMALQEHGRQLRSLGRLENSRKAIAEGIIHQTTFVEMRESSPLGRRMLATLYAELEKTLRRLKRTDEADEAASESKRLRDRRFDPHISNATMGRADIGFQAKL